MTPPRSGPLWAAAPLLAVLAGCSGGSAARSLPPAPSAAAEGVVTYRVADYTLPPLTVAPGTTLRLVDGDDEAHTVTADDGSFDSGAFDKADPGTLTAPSVPGSYAIHCTIHPSMRGTLVVR